jgi:hypothetical protein
MDESETSMRIRELLAIPALQRSRAPRWILNRVKVAIKEGDLPRSPTALTSGTTALSHVAGVHGHSWADHPGTLKWEGYELLVTEPYAADISGVMLEQLDAAARVLKAAYLFSATSEWFPGRTIRVFVAESPEVMSRFRKYEHVFGSSKKRDR